MKLKIVHLLKFIPGLLTIVIWQASTNCAVLQTQAQSNSRTPKVRMPAPIPIVELAARQNIEKLIREGTELLSRGQLQEAEQVFLQALQQIRKTANVPPMDRLCVLQGLGQSQLRQQKYADAEKSYSDAKMLIEISLPNTNNWHALVLDSLGQAYRLQDKLDLAEPCYKEALAIEEKGGGRDSLDSATTKCNLALLCIQQGREDEAESYLVEALPVCCKAWGPTNPNYMGLVNTYRRVLSVTGHKSRVPGITD
jgi:tetratricopeptide (TPR) repeat protein